MRRVGATVLSAGLVLGAGSGVATWHALRDGPGASDVQSLTFAAAPDPAGTPADRPSSEPSSPTAIPTPDAATATPATPSPSPSESDGPLGPPDPVATAVAYQPSASSWAGDSGGFHIEVSASPSTLRAGQEARFTVMVSGPGTCCHVAMVFGNGRVANDGTCGGDQPSEELATVYNRPGRYEFLVQVTADGDCARDGVLEGWVDVAAGASSAQGPSQPVVEADSSTRPVGHESDFSYVSVFGHAADADGWLRRLVVDYGDGSAPVTFPVADGPCNEAADGWPAGTEGYLPGGGSPPAHHYAAPGTYTVTVTAYSTGCDGTQEQSGSASFRWTF